MKSRSRAGLAGFGWRGALGALGLALVAIPAGAQIPDDFTNLQILPKDIEKRQLVAAMRHFAGSLGVRCNHCHVGRDDLQDMDFASDEKLAKRQARHMMKMVQSLTRDHLATLPGEGPKAEAACNTCHHGVLRPVMLEVILDEVAAEAGAPAALQRYAELREQYYGRGAYDFGERSLVRLARLLAGRQEVAEAVLVLRRNVELFPESAGALAALGDGLLKADDRAGAIASYRRALELSPGDRFLEQRLKDIEETAPLP